jgi:hypothetical protein
MGGLSSYWHSVVVRAFWDSFRALETNPRLLLLGLLGAVVTAVLVLLCRGWKPFVEHLIANIAIAFGGAVITWLLVFVWVFVNPPAKMLMESSANLAQVIQEKQEFSRQINFLNATVEGLRQLPKNPPPAGGGHQTLDNTAQIQAAVRKVLNFPNAVEDSIAPKTMLETLLTNQTPRKLFDVLAQYDDSAIGAVPAGPSLVEYFHKYYQFENDEVQFENELLRQIGSTVVVRFPAGWEIYLKYAVLRFSGKSKDQVIAESNFLNYDITWDDTDRVYEQLSKNEMISKKFENMFSQYKSFVETINQLKVGH